MNNDEERTISDDAALKNLTLELFADGEEALTEYFSLAGGAPFTGARFDSFGQNAPVRITSDDLLATMLLSISVRPLQESMAGWAPNHLIAIHDHTEEISELLRQLPPDVDLHQLAEAEARQLVGWDNDEASPARRLYELIRRQLPTEHGPGRVAVYKLLARKRPRLLPIRDSIVEKAVGHQSPDTWWMPWWHSLTTVDGLVERLQQLQANVPEPLRPSPLRTADIIIWMRNR